MYREWLKSIHSAPLFKGIDDESLNAMLSCMKPKVRQFKQREVVAFHGQPFNGIGIIAAGRVSLNKETISGNRIILNILDSGDIFGEMVAFSDIKIWPVTVIAQDDTSLLFLPPDKVLGNCANICASHSTLIMNTLKILSNRALTLNQRIEHLSSRSIRGKVSRYLIDQYHQSGRAKLEIPLKRHELADYLNIPRPSLSRELANLRDQGFIDFGGANINLLNPLAVEKLVE